MSRSVKLDTESLRAAQARTQQADRVSHEHGPTGMDPSVTIAHVLEWHKEGDDFSVCGDTNALLYTKEQP